MADVELSTLGNVIKSAYEAEADTNAFTDAEKAKLAEGALDEYFYANAAPTISGGTLVLPIDGKTREVSWNANITSIDTTGSLAYSDTTVVLTMDGTLRTVAWPAGWLWLGTPPDAAANDVLVLKLETVNSTVYASAALAEVLS